MSSINNYLKSNAFKNKNILITGATGTIGSEVTKKFLLCGSKIVGLVHSLNKISPDFNHYLANDQIKFIQLDLNASPKITEKFKEAMLYLKGKLDILICCHGKFIPGDVRKVKTDNFDQNLNINVRANFHLLSLSVPFLKITKGNVVMISSVTSKIVEKGDFLQALSKNMINSLIQNSALELASFGVRVNGVALGCVEGDYRKSSFKENNENYLGMMKNFNLLEKKNLEPENVADSIIFLASDEASYVTGSIYNVDGGAGAP